MTNCSWAQPPEEDEMGRTVTVDIDLVKSVEGLRNHLRDLEILTETGTLSYDGGDTGDYQAPCRYPHLQIRYDE
jgi:hypothetical protein